MPRSRLAFLVLLGAWLLGPSLAAASGDFGCTVSWKLKQVGLADCDNQPFLSPGNDTQVNLQLLLLDAGTETIGAASAANAAQSDVYPPLAGPSPFSLAGFDAWIAPPPPEESPNGRADGEGSRCDSNPDGIDAFNAAVNASRAPPDERASLISARAALKPTCADDGKPLAAAPPPPAVRSSDGQAFAAYLDGARAFYEGRYADAAARFQALASSRQAWVREAARYMAGRIALNRAQAGAFDSYGNLDLAKIDASGVADAKAGFEAYLKTYPSGAYARSARGLLRRVAWFGGRKTDLADGLARALAARGAPGPAMLDLVSEADRKLFADAAPADVRDPTLLAVLDLMRMRHADSDASVQPIDKTTLEAQAPVFAGNPALFDYLRAVHALNVEADPAGALARLPEAPPPGPMTYLAVSQQMVRGLALEAEGKAAAARAHWRALMPVARPPFQHAALELGLAMNLERAGDLDAVFADGSPITDPDLRELLLKTSAAPALLRRQAHLASAPAHERAVALDTLLYKEISRSRYQAFVADLAGLPPPPPTAPADAATAPPDPDFAPFRWDGKSDDGYACPPLRALAEGLARNPADPAGRLCLAEFVRASSLDDDPLDTRPPADELGGAPSQFPGSAFSRLEIYKGLIGDPKAPPEVRAYALYRAVQCYGPSGYDHCGGADVPLAQRKAWFQTLKTHYPASVWADRLKYYW